MPQLNGVVTANSDVIVYGGVSYRKTYCYAKEGDIVRNDVHGFTFLPKGAHYAVYRLEDKIRVNDEDGANLNIEGDEDFTVFRLEAAALTTVQLIEQKRTELAELEARLAEESTLKVGDYAKVTGEALGGDLSEGDIVKIVDIDDSGDDYPYNARKLLGGSDEWDWVRQLERLTPAEARAALIAQVDALFGEEAPN